MTIEKIIKSTAKENFPNFSFVYDNWENADAILERLEYPAIVCIMPTSGTTEIRNGRVYDRENIALAFLDLVPRGADGEENGEVCNQMKAEGAKFISNLNSSRYLEPIIGEQTYTTVYERMSTIVTGVIYQLSVKQQIGYCL